MRRSKSGMDVSTGWRRGASASLRAVAVALATVPPGDHESEDDMQPAEAGAEEGIGERWRGEAGGDADEHEADPHHRHDRDGELAARNERRTVEKKPHRGKREIQAAMTQNVRQ